jgi:hypothetical protein
MKQENKDFIITIFKKEGEYLAALCISYLVNPEKQK